MKSKLGFFKEKTSWIVLVPCIAVWIFGIAVFITSYYEGF